MTSIEHLTPSSSPTNSDTLTWQVTFSEDVMGVNAEDFELAGANAVTLSVSTVTASTVFNVTASGGDLATLNRRVTLYFTTHQNITDTANNALANTSPTGTSERTYVVDNAPTVTIFSVPLTSTGPFTARFIFSEAVTGFTVGDITLTNATALASSFVTLNSSVYTVLITPTTNGALTVDVAADVVMDAMGNNNTAAVRASSTYDPSATVAGICGRTEPVRAEILAAIDDISVCDHVTSAHLSTVGPPDSLSLNNMYITTLAAGDFDGLTSLVTLNLFENQLTSLPSGIFNDLTSLQLLYLNKNALTALPDGVFNNLINLVAMKLQHNELTALPDRVFEPLRNLRRLQLHSNPGADFSPTAVAQPDNGTVPDTGGMVTLDGSGSSGEAWGSYVTYSWALTSPATGVTVEFDNNEIASPTVTIPALAGYTELTFTLTVTGRGAISGATAGVDTATVRVADGTAPRVASITRQSPTSSPTHADDPTWLVTFSEDVANVDAADFMLSGTTATLTVSKVTASSAYSVMASGGNLDALDGTVTLDFAAGQDIADIAGHALANTTPTGTNDNTYLVDNTVPTVTISGVPANSSMPFTATFTFSEGVTDFAATDIALGNGAASSFTGSAGDTAYTAVITPPATGTVTLDVAAGAAMDLAGNDNTAAARAISTYDSTYDPSRGICGRTGAVRIGILGLISGVSNCADVTTQHLAAIDSTAYLDLNSKSITTLATGDFAGLTSLGSLWLNRNQLTSLPDGIFDELTGLTSLTLSRNSLTALPDDIFDNLTALVTLWLNSNNLSTLPVGIFDNLTVLTSLLLDGNQLATLPDGAFESLTLLTATGLRLQGNPGAPFSPTAVALPDAGTVAATGGDVMLDGSGSSGEAWGSNVTYSWALTSPATGVTVDFDDNEIASPTVTIPALAANTELIFTLTVTGRGGTNGIDTATDTATVTVQTAESLALNVGAIAGDDIINIAEKAAGFDISGDTGTEAGVAVTVQVGTATLSATSADDSGTATWSVSVPADASYITGASVVVSVSAAKTGFTASADVQRTLTVDLDAPEVVSIVRHSPAASPTDEDSLVWRVTFSEAIANVDAADFAVTGTTATITVASVSGADAVDVTVTGGDLTDLDGTVTLAFASAQDITDDEAGNELTNTTPTGTNNNDYVVDNTAPAVTIGGVPATSTAAFTATITFTEPVTGFVKGDITLANANATAFTATDAMIYTALITPTADGAVTLDVAANAATDAAGNGNTAAEQASSVFDSTAPTVMSIVRQTPLSSPTNADSLTWRVMFSENVANVNEADFTVSGTTAALTVSEVTASTVFDVKADGGDLASLDATAALSFASGQDIVDTAGNELTNTTPSGTNDNNYVLDNTAPVAPTYTAPGSLKVGAAITTMSPTGAIGVNEYSASGLPTGLSINASTGVISGTPSAADTGTASVTVTVSDTASNTATVGITFPAVAKGDQTLSGFSYSASSVTFGSAAPTVTAPGGAKGDLSYAASPSDVCTVEAATGALTLEGVGSCTVTVTAAATANYNEATDTATVTVQTAGSLLLNLDMIAGDNTVNIAEKAEGFAISGATGTEVGVAVTVQVGTTTLNATSADDNGMATWSVDVPAGAVYITGTSVDVRVSAAKTGFTAPADVQRTLTVDLVAPVAPTYTAPGSLKVGAAITTMSPTGAIGVNEYSAAGLPTGLSIDDGAGVISGTPTAAATATASVTVTVNDAAGNTDTVDITFPAVAKGDQTLSGFSYSASSVTFGSAAPTVTAPSGVETTLSYAASPSNVCTVEAATGVLTLTGVGSCAVTVTAAATADYNAATDTATVTVQTAGTLVLNVDAVTGDDTVNIAEKAEGFAISGNTGSEAGVAVTVEVGGTNLTATSSTSDPATWSVDVPAGAVYITGTSVDVRVSAAKTGFTAPADVQRTLTVDLVAPVAPTYTAPGSLKVGAAITTMSPTGAIGVNEYSASGLPTGLSIDDGAGVISGTPTAAATATASVTVTVNDAAGNTDTVDITFPAVAKGDQTLSGFSYSASSVTFGSAAPTVTAPSGVETTLSYAASPSNVCTVEAATGALTLTGVGSCAVTATAAATADYNAATDTATVTVQTAGTLVLNVDAVTGDDTVNIAEKAEGFAIGGNTGTEAGVMVTLKVGTATLSATSADDNGTATWSVDVPAGAVYITGASVVVTVSAAKTGFTAPADVQRTLTIDLTAPTAPSYTAPGSLKVGAAITTMSPTGAIGVNEYNASGLPTGLSINASTGVISGTPTAAATATASVTVTVSDSGGNSATVGITFPMVAKGDQTLNGFSYSASSVTFGSAAPTLTAPGGAQGALSYTATPATACTVEAATGALTLEGVGSCTVTVTAAATANYNEATDTATVTVQTAGTLVLNVDAVTGDDTVNIAEKAEGFAIGGNTGSEAGVTVTVQVGTATLNATLADDNGTATWSVDVPVAAVYITGTSVVVRVSAAKTGFTAPADVQRTLTIDLTAPTAPSYTAPGSLKVGAAITTMSPTGAIGVNEYSASGLPTGLSINASTGVISGTPTAADTGAASVTVTVSDTAGNSATVGITFPMVAKGDQTLSGFSYSASSVTFGSAAPTLTAPGGAQGTLSYAASPSNVCTVDATTGALTLAGVGSCAVTVTAAATADYNAATDTATVTVQTAGALVLNVDAVTGDDTVNIAEKAEGFAISGNTGSEAGVAVTVEVGGTNLTATSSTSIRRLVGERAGGGGVHHGDERGCERDGGQDRVHRAGRRAAHADHRPRRRRRRRHTRRRVR